MKKCFHRLAAVLLVVCLVVDPTARAFAQSYPVAPIRHDIGAFDLQAITPPGANFIGPAIDGDVNIAKVEEGKGAKSAVALLPAAPAEQAKLAKIPQGSPLGVFEMLLSKDRLLRRQLSSLRPDLRALEKHLGLARLVSIDGGIAYELLQEARQHSDSIRGILSEMQRNARRHYRPTVREMTIARRSIDALLDRPVGASRGKLLRLSPDDLLAKAIEKIVGPTGEGRALSMMQLRGVLRVIVDEVRLHVVWVQVTGRPILSQDHDPHAELGQLWQKTFEVGWAELQRVLQSQMPLNDAPGSKSESPRTSGYRIHLVASPSPIPVLNIEVVESDAVSTPDAAATAEKRQGRKNLDAAA